MFGGKKVKVDYLTDVEYKTYWIKLEGVRGKIVEKINYLEDSKILDVGTGWGLFSLELAKRARLMNNMEEKISIKEMDATSLDFPDEHFDLTTSFLGMRDIHMTRGENGVRKAGEEMIRVTKAQGKIVLCLTPPEDMDQESLRIAVEVEGDVFGAKSLPKGFYIDIFQENNVHINNISSFYTGKKLIVRQAQNEIREGLEIVKRVYKLPVQSFTEVWSKYGELVEKQGYGMYSKIIVIQARKSI